MRNMFKYRTRAIADPFVRRDNDRACTSWDGWHHSAVPFGGTRLTICDVRFHGKYRGITGLIAEAVKTALLTHSCRFRRAYRDPNSIWNTGRLSQELNGQSLDPG